MKKPTIIMILFTLIFCFAACGTTTPEAANSPAPEENPSAVDPETSGGIAGIANPRTEVSSLAELNEAFGCALHKLAVMGVTDEVFAIINCGDFKIADYQYTVNGLKYCYRFSPNIEQDISGVYFGGRPAFSDKPTGDWEYSEFSEEGRAARWFEVNGQYVLSVMDGGILEEDVFLSIVNELKGMAFCTMREGEYIDRVSERARLTVTANGGENVEIAVSWASSASERTVWTMHAKYGEGGILSYSDAEKVIETTDADGETATEAVYQDGSGYFRFGEDRILYWEGAADEECRSCEFTAICYEL